MLGNIQSLIKNLPDTQTPREPLPDHTECPWTNKSCWEVYPEGVIPPIRETKAHITIFTDGSVTGGTNTGSAAVVATVGNPADPVINHTSIYVRLS